MYFCVLCIFLFCVVLCIVCVYMCTVLLPPGGYPIAVKYIISYIYHIMYYIYHIIQNMGVRFRIRAADSFSLQQNVQTGSQAHPDYCSMCTRSFFKKGEAAGA